MNPKKQGNRNLSQTPADAWLEFIQAEVKQGSKIGKAFEKAGFAGLYNKVLTVYVEDESTAKMAKGQIEPLKKKLPPALRPCDRVQVNVGNVPRVAQTTGEVKHKKTISVGSGKSFTTSTPLQALYIKHIDIYDQNSAQPLLEDAKEAENQCQGIYDRLKQRTELLAASGGTVFSASFSWKLRVGGTRGFMELLLPVLHPIFGVPYIPASSLKGAARAWARQNGESKDEISKILGLLEGKVAQAAKVEFLDAFPTAKCLSVDVATPQWKWDNSHHVTYKPEPHPLLSLEKPQFLFGLRPTKPEHSKYVPIVQEWLENALKSGIGSRVSSGYGRVLGQIPTFPHSQSYNFELWTQGMYGVEPPSKQNGWRGSVEFRPTAIRGILRYWFRAFALSLYEPTICQMLEDQIFGKLGQQGQACISVIYNDSPKIEGLKPYRYSGKICLEATEQRYLNLISQLLVLASHLGGVGRGSRRPLHLLDVEGRKYMRGCHWVVDVEGMPLKDDVTAWQNLFKQVKTAFEAVQKPISAHNRDPGSPNQRRQDVLDANAQVWLVQSSEQIPPHLVENWSDTKTINKVRGKALNLFYSNPKFKGQGKDGRGNPQVGGTLGVPSFVWIKSIFPRNGHPYQVVSIFGADQPDRKAFAQELARLARQENHQVKRIFPSQ